MEVARFHLARERSRIDEEIGQEEMPLMGPLKEALAKAESK